MLEVFIIFAYGSWRSPGSQQVGNCYLAPFSLPAQTARSIVRTGSLLKSDPTLQHCLQAQVLSFVSALHSDGDGNEMINSFCPLCEVI